jgi:hypothetical protein
VEKPEHWKMYFDGSLNLEGVGEGVLFISPQGDHLKYILQIHYKASNNGAEYEALIHGLRIAVSLGYEALIHKVKREKIVMRSTNYVVIGTELYRRSASNGVLMKCILRSEGLQLLQEIHGGECGNHATFVNLVGKAFRSGFYWPIALADAQDLVRQCKG